MFELFKRLVRKESPDFILGMTTAHYAQLCAVTCKYSKGSSYYAAVTFYTDTWISADPYGPLGQKSENSCDTLSDIATVREFNSLQACKDFQDVTAKDIESFLFKLERATMNQFASVFEGNPYGDTVTSKLILAPLPAVVISVKNADNLVGTLLLLLNGVIYPVFSVSSRLNEYVTHMQKLITLGGTNGTKIQPLTLSAMRSDQFG